MRRRRRTPTSPSRSPGDASINRRSKSRSATISVGAAHVAADHAADPADRVRRGRSPPCVPLLLALTAVIATIGLMGPISHAQRGRQLDQRGDPADRPRGGGRLLDVLPAPRARGARVRAKRVGCAGGRGCDLGPGGDDLRPHGDDRDGRDVPGRRLDVPIVRHRHDPRRRGRGPGVADRPPAQPWPGWATGSRRAAFPIIKDQPWNAGESALWSRILNPVLRHPVVSVLLAGGLLVVLSIPAFSLHTANPGVETLPQDLSVIQTYNQHAGRLPGRPDPGHRRRQRRRRDLTRGPGGDRRSDAPGGARARAFRAADHDRRQLRQDRRPGQHPAGRRRRQLAVDRGARRAARHAHPGDDRDRAGRHRRCRPATPPTRRTSPTR